MWALLTLDTYCQFVIDLNEARRFGEEIPIDLHLEGGSDSGPAIGAESPVHPCWNRIIRGAGCLKLLVYRYVMFCQQGAVCGCYFFTSHVKVKSICIPNTVQ